jgi:hypothetical protein
MTFDGSSNGLVQDNYVHDADQLGLTTFRGANNITFRHNKLEYISIKRDGTVWFNSASAALYADSGYSIVMERNFVNHAGLGVEALSEPGQPATHDVRINNNLVQHCQKGIVLGTFYSSTDGATVSNINVWNNTFYYNALGVLVRPMLSSTVTWKNNLFADNVKTYSNPLNWDPGTVGYNVYFGGGNGPGFGNLTSDPLFVSSSTENFSLRTQSPAIDAGDPNSATDLFGTVDLAGNPRIQGGRVDIGAYEVR